MGFKFPSLEKERTMSKAFFGLRKHHISRCISNSTLDS